MEPYEGLQKPYVSNQNDGNKYIYIDIRPQRNPRTLLFPKGKFM